MGYIKSFRFLWSVIFVTTIFPVIFAQQNNSPDYRLSIKGLVKVPIDLFENNILVKFQINNSQPVWCILDTGASVNVLNDKFAASIGLSNGGKAKLNAGGGMVQGSAVENAVVSLPGVTAYKQRIVLVPLAMLPQYFGRNVVGIIGTDFIKNFVIKIDHAHKTLTFYDPKTYNLSNEPDAISIENKDNVPYTQIELSLAGQKTITADFELDTGSSRSLQINHPFSEKNQILNILPKSKTLEGIGGAGVGGDTSFIDARINSLRIGKYTLNNPVVSISQDTTGTGAGEDSGVIGTEIFRRFTVILDYQSQKILLKPNKYFSEPFESDMSGLELVTGTNNFKEIRIKTVRKNFPAAESGLQPDDIITSINGHPIMEFDLDKLSKMFRQAGSEYRLTVKRNYKLIKVRLKLKRLI